MFQRHDFPTGARRPSPPRIPDARPLTARDYLVLRRRAAGLSQEDLARRMATLHGATAARRPGGRMPDITRTMLLVVRSLELRGATARRRETINAIAAVLPFDAAVYWQLAHDAPARHPRVCRGCGASTHDPDAVSWSTRGSCTRCDPAGTGL